MDQLKTGFFLRNKISLEGRLSFFDWNTTGDEIIVFLNDCTICHIDYNSGLLIKSYKKEAFSYSPVCLLPDDKGFCSVSRKNALLFWSDFETTSPIAHEGVFGPISCVACTLKGDLIASGSSDRSVRIWDTLTNSLQSTLGQHSGKVTALCWQKSMEAPLIASGDENGNLHVWNINNCTLVASFKAHEGPVNTIDWSPSSKFLSSGSLDGTLFVWDTKKNEKRKLEGYAGSLTSVSFDPMGIFLSARSSNKDVIIWSIKKWNIVQLLKCDLSTASKPGIVSFHPHKPYFANGDINGSSIEIYDYAGFPKFSNIGFLSDSDHYVNAKVVTVGNGGVGKTALGIFLAERRYRPTDTMNRPGFDGDSTV